MAGFRLCNIVIYDARYNGLSSSPFLSSTSLVICAFTLISACAYYLVEEMRQIMEKHAKHQLKKNKKMPYLTN